MKNSNKLANNFFSLGYNSKGLNSIIYPDDTHKMDFILQDDNNYVNYNEIFNELGEFNLLYEKNRQTLSFESDAECEIKNQNISITRKNSDLKIEQNFTLKDDYLRWDISINNLSRGELSILDFELPLCFNTAYARAWQETYLRRAIRHSFVAGNGSFIFLNRAGGDPPMLLMMPLLGTSVDCFDVENTNDAGRFEGKFSIYLHARNKNKNNEWRLPTPRGVIEKDGCGKYGFIFKWAENYDRIRKCLYSNNLIDIRVMPGMTVPVGLECKILLKTKLESLSLKPEFPKYTILKNYNVEGPNHMYSIFFKKLGAFIPAAQTTNEDTIFFPL